MCRVPKSVDEVEEEEEDVIFVGSIMPDGDPWIVDIDIHDSSLTFKIDTGDNFTVLIYPLEQHVAGHSTHAPQSNKAIPQT